MILTRPAPEVDGELRHFSGQEEVEALRAAIGALGGRLAVVEGDVASAQDIQRAVDAAVSLGGSVEILVNNAATDCLHPVIGHDETLWRRVVEVNLVGAFLAIRSVLPMMIERGFGRIISIASTAAHAGSAGYSAYCASKHGLLGLHRALVHEIRADDVTVNTISPSWIDTPSARLHIRCQADRAHTTYEEYLAGILREMPQQRLIRPDEVASLVAFLCGHEGTGIHGTDILLTGGSSL